MLATTTTQSAEDRASQLQRIRDATPRDPDQLHRWLTGALDVRIARRPTAEGSSSPFDYLQHSFFEGRLFHADNPEHDDFLPADCVVWANRGGGKTFMGAVATLLDLVFKSGIQIRILGGSLEQSLRMHAYLTSLASRPGVLELTRPTGLGSTRRRLKMDNGSCAQVLAASERSVRGMRIQKVRCDEVELFDRAVWEAAQLTTRAAEIRGPWGTRTRGSVEALSTLHVPRGLMWELVDASSHIAQGTPANGSGATSESQPTGSGSESRTTTKPGAESLSTSASPTFTARRIFRWGLIDTLEHCGLEHECHRCVLLPDCNGRAKESGRAGGHIRIADAVSMKHRVDAKSWESEMLCLRPSRSDAVYDEFDPRIHVYGDGADGCHGSALRPVPRDDHGVWAVGMDFGFRSETVLLLACIDHTGVVRIVDEHSSRAQRLEEYVAVLRGWERRGPSIRRPAKHSHQPSTPSTHEELGESPPHGALRIAWLGIDPAGENVQDLPGISNAMALRRAGFQVRSRRVERQPGIAMVKALLAPAAGPVRLLIHARCTRLIECLEAYRYNPNRPESIDPIKDGHDHACDALRYLVVNMQRAGQGTMVGGWE